MLNVDSQQLFLGTRNKVYFIDKVENNPTQIKGHPAWASGEYIVSIVYALWAECDSRTKSGR